MWTNTYISECFFFSFVKHQFRLQVHFYCNWVFFSVWLARTWTPFSFKMHRLKKTPVTEIGISLNKRTSKIENIKNKFPDPNKEMKALKNRFSFWFENTLWFQESLLIFNTFCFESFYKRIYLIVLNKYKY